MRRRRFSHWASANYGNKVTTLTNSRVDEINAAFIFARPDFGPVAHRIIVKEVSQTPPPPPIISVTHVRADENER